MSVNYGEESTLKRVRRTGQQTYRRTLSRQIDWPVNDFKQKPVQEVQRHQRDTELDDAFSSVLQFMSQTTQQCKRYYRNRPATDPQSQEACHCERFHSPKYTTVKSRNTLERSEDINVVVDPGSYAITAGRCGTQQQQQQQQSHVVHMQEGDTVELEFVL